MTVALPPERRLPRRLTRAPGAIVLPRIPAPAALLLAGWTLLLAAWTFGNPPFLAPDEGAHYLRAVAVGEGKLGADLEPTVPARLWGAWRHPAGSTCNAGQSDVPATCVEDVDRLTADVKVATSAGAYPPLYYVLPGALLHLADDPFSALRLGRMGGALVGLVFLALAVALLVARDAPRVSLLGLLVAVTPMVVFVQSSLNSSGLEIPAGIAFFAALLRLARGDPARWVWGAAFAAGAALALTRAPGMLWIGIDLVLFAALVGARGALRAVRAAPPWAVVPAAVVAVGIVASRLWEHAHGNPITQQGPAAAGGLSEIRFWLWHGIQELPRTFNEQVGVFGWLDTIMPKVFYPAWHAMVAGLVVVALITARRRERWVLAGAVVAVLGVTAVASATLVAATNQDVQGRHVLPLAVVVPLLAGELVYRNRARLALVDLGALFSWFAALAAVMHAVGWYANAYRQSVGTSGPRYFLPHAEWSPPLGWATWLVLAFAGAALLAASAAGPPRWRLRR
ncbi:MAG: DUF2142 domain-containing protein [Thermoleophilia bacterium]|nr:DUF2142 domain-containing protein [Thermoleophilia bacterium]